jgi:hypothetical protein
MISDVFFQPSNLVLVVPDFVQSVLRLPTCPCLSSPSKTVSHVWMCGTEKGVGLGEGVRPEACGKWGVDFQHGNRVE